MNITNHGGLITATSYFGSPLDVAGLPYLSPHAGVLRVLLPRAMRSMTGYMRSPTVLISVADSAVYLTWHQLDSEPLVLQFPEGQYDRLPERRDDWVVAVWCQKGQRPHKAVERPGEWRG